MVLYPAKRNFFAERSDAEAAQVTRIWAVGLVTNLLEKKRRERDLRGNDTPSICHRKTFQPLLASRYSADIIGSSSYQMKQVPLFITRRDGGRWDYVALLIILPILVVPTSSTSASLCSCHILRRRVDNTMLRVEMLRCCSVNVSHRREDEGHRRL